MCVGDVNKKNMTLPNHYITDNTMVVDMRGKTALVPVNGQIPTLLIGGVPFHVVGTSRGCDNGGGDGVAVPVYTSLGAPSIYNHNGVPMYTRDGVYPRDDGIYAQNTMSTMAPSPIYETIDSECSEWSSGYSERGEVGSLVYQDIAYTQQDMSYHYPAGPGQDRRGGGGGEDPGRDQYRDRQGKTKMGHQPRAGDCSMTQPRGHGGHQRQRQIATESQVTLQTLPSDRSPVTNL